MRLNDFKEQIEKFNSDNPMNPDVAVRGYGVLSLNGLERMVAEDLSKLAKLAQEGNWENVTYMLERSPLMAKIEAINSAYEQLEQRRSRGGRNSRGIEKR